jgi:hypothetical protein
MPDLSAQFTGPTFAGPTAKQFQDMRNSGRPQANLALINLRAAWNAAHRGQDALNFVLTTYRYQRLRNAGAKKQP